MRSSWVFVLFLFSTVVVWCVQGTGHLAIRLVEYNHPSPGRLLNGDCCDGVSTTDCSHVICDPYFIITITEPNHQTSAINLEYQTGTMQDEEFFIFADTIGGAVNPVNNSISVWPGAVEVLVTVMDNNTDAGVPDGIMANTTARYSLEKTPLLHNETQFFPLDFDKLSVQAVINVRCDRFYTYDQFCYTHCAGRDNATGHFTCNSDGQPICLPGWSGPPSCVTGSCSPGPCQNGGLCAVNQGFASCSCPPGYTGRLCDQPLTTSPPPAPTSTVSSRRPTGHNNPPTSTRTTTTTTSTTSPIGSTSPSAWNGSGTTGGGIRGGGSNQDNDDGSNAGAIAGGVLGGLAALGLLALLFFLLARRKRNREKVDPEDTSKAADGETGEQPPTEEVPKADNPSSTDKELSSLGPGTPQVLPEVE